MLDFEIFLDIFMKKKDIFVISFIILVVVRVVGKCVMILVLGILVMFKSEVSVCLILTNNSVLNLCNIFGIFE